MEHVEPPRRVQDLLVRRRATRALRPLGLRLRLRVRARRLERVTFSFPLFLYRGARREGHAPQVDAHVVQ